MIAQLDLMIIDLKRIIRHICIFKSILFTIVLTEMLVPMMDSLLLSLDNSSPQLEATLLRLGTSFGLPIYLELYDRGEGVNCSRKFSRDCLLFPQSSSCSQNNVSLLLPNLRLHSEKCLFYVPCCLSQNQQLQAKALHNICTFFFFHHFERLCMLHSLQLFTIYSVKAAVRHGLQNKMCISLLTENTEGRDNQ